MREIFDAFSLTDKSDEGKTPMTKNRTLSVLAIVLAVAVPSFAAARVTALTSIATPAGTKVGLTFLDPVDTSKVKPGYKVRFRVDANTMVKGHIVIRKGTKLTGTVATVGHPFLRHAGYANISHLAVVSVDKKTLGLNDVRVGASLFHGDIKVRPGTHTKTSTKKNVTIKAP
jgi:hypothetical protein